MKPDYDRHVALARECHALLLDSLNLPESVMPYVPPPRCRHFHSGVEDCGYACLMVFGDRFLTVEKEKK